MPLNCTVGGSNGPKLAKSKFWPETTRRSSGLPRRSSSVHQRAFETCSRQLLASVANPRPSATAVGDSSRHGPRTSSSMSTRSATPRHTPSVNPPVAVIVELQSASAASMRSVCAAVVPSMTTRMSATRTGPRAPSAPSTVNATRAPGASPSSPFASRLPNVAPANDRLRRPTRPRPCGCCHVPPSVRSAVNAPPTSGTSRSSCSSSASTVSSRLARSSAPVSTT